MDDFVAGTYMRELVHQGEAAQIAAQDFNEALAAKDARTVPRAFAAMQSLLAAAAMMSKLLWPKPPSVRLDGSPLTEPEETQRKATVARGRFLRQALQIKVIPVLESRKVRNALEHFDDRLDRYFEAGHRNVFDRNIGPRDRLVVMDGQPPMHLRLIDPDKGTISVLEDEVSIHELFDAIMDVQRRAEAWASPGSD